MTEQNLRGQTAIITGGSTEVARAVAVALARNGVKIYLGGKRADLLDLAAEQIHAAGGQCQTFTTELDDLEAAETVVQSVSGPLNILVIVSPFWAGGQIHAHSPKTWDLVLNANVREAFLITRATLPIFRAQKRGEVLVIGSDSALGFYAQDGAYGVAMHALKALMELVRVENAEFGIRTHLLAPGVAVTSGEDADGRPTLSASDIAEWVVWLLTRPPHLRSNGPILV